MWQDVKLSLSPERLCDFRTTTSSLWDSDCSEDLSSLGIMLTLRQGQRLLQQKGRCVWWWGGGMVSVRRLALSTEHECLCYKGKGKLRGWGVGLAEPGSDGPMASMPFSSPQATARACSCCNTMSRATWAWQFVTTKSLIS